jgi:hypothetical protein
MPAADLVQTASASPAAVAITDHKRGLRSITERLTNLFA